MQYFNQDLEIKSTDKQDICATLCEVLLQKYQNRVTTSQTYKAPIFYKLQSKRLSLKPKINIDTQALHIYKSQR